MALAIAAGAVLLISVIAFRRCLPYVGGDLAPGQPPAVVIRMDNTYLVGFGRSGKLYSLRAKKIEVGQDRSIITLTGITDGRIFNRRKTAVQVSAGRAVYDSTHETLQLFGGILAQSANGQKVMAEGADWNSHTGLLRSRGRVLFVTGWGAAATDEVVVDLRNRVLTMRNVSGWVDLQRASAGGVLR